MNNHRNTETFSQFSLMVGKAKEEVYELAYDRLLDFDKYKGQGVTGELLDIYTALDDAARKLRKAHILIEKFRTSRSNTSEKI